MPRVCVATWSDSGCSSYANYTRILNRSYCKRHSYDFRSSSQRRRSEKHKHWPQYEKIYFVLELLNRNKWDYVVWLDADAAFRRDAPDLSYYTNMKKAIVFSKDIRSSGAGRFGVNTGVFICKNGPRAKQFLRRWRAYPDIGHAHRDQATCRKLLPSIKYTNRFHITPFGKLQVFHNRKKWRNGQGQWIVHLAGRDARTRRDVFKKMVDDDALRLRRRRRRRRRRRAAAAARAASASASQPPHKT